MANTLNNEPYFYNSQYSGAEVDVAVGRALNGGALDITDAALNAQINANTNLLNMVKTQVLNDDGSSKIAPIATAANQATENANTALGLAQTATARINDSTTGLAAIWAALNNVGTVFEAGSYEGDGLKNKTITSNSKMMAVACFISVEDNTEQFYLITPIIAGSFSANVLRITPAGEIRIYHPSCYISLNSDGVHSDVFLSSSNMQGAEPSASMNKQGVTYNYMLIGVGLGA